MSRRASSGYNVPETEPWPTILTILQGFDIEYFAQIQSWRELHVKCLTGGATNVIYAVTLRRTTPLRTVIVRLYGAGTDFLNREEEERAIRLLAQSGHAPQIYATFPGGRVEEFLPFRTCSREDMRHLIQPIATGVAQIHAKVRLPSSDSGAFRRRLLGWDPMQQLSAEIDFLCKALEEVRSPLCYVHSDLQAYNIMTESTTGEIRFIDYEYGFYGPRAFDIGNHFCEWAMQNTGPAPLGYVFREAWYPTKGDRETFLRHYLRASSVGDVTDAAVDELQCEATVGMLASHLHWALWAFLKAGPKEKLPQGGRLHLSPGFKPFYNTEFDSNPPREPPLLRLHESIESSSEGKDEEKVEAAAAEFNLEAYGALRLGEYYKFKSEVVAMLAGRVTN